jgi:RimJ/RimL family protein N-acetyltransferase
MIIRAAKKKDLPELMDLLERFLHETSELGADFAPTVKTMRWLFDVAYNAVDGQGSLSLACNGKGPVGFCLNAEFETPYDHALGRVAIGIGTWVDESHRGKGYATAMRKKAYKILGDRGVKALIGTVSEKNDAAKAAALKAGAVPYGYQIAMKLGD